MSDIWERRLTGLLGLTVILIAVGVFFGWLGAFGVGVAALLGHYCGRHETDGL